MKTLRLLFIAVLTLFSFGLFAQTAPGEKEKLNLPGDNLNLYAVLKLFQESKTLEGFERSLNDSTTRINNLDLDGDNKIDYIRVVDKPDGDVHNITLKDAVSKTEEQDIAVFVVQKKGNGQANIQLIGDEDLYGKNYIIEPNTDIATTSSETPNPGYTNTATLANGETVPVQTTTEYEIASWPVVQYIYVPTYTVWESPWSWSYYPDYWRPWRPHYWHYYYGYQFNYQPYYYGHYRRWNSYRVPGWYGRYYGSNFRSRSPYVQRRYQEGYYRRTYARPQSARNGATAFRRDNPQAPVAHALPNFNNAGQPVPVRATSANQGIRPVKPNPVVTEPGTRPVRPVRQPGVKPTKPSISDDQPVRPTTQQSGIKPVRPVKVAPVRESPVRDEPVRQAPVRETPVREEPVRQAPVRETPVREQPVRQAPVRQAPVRNEPVRQAPTRPVQEIRPAAPRQQPVRRESAPASPNPVRRDRGN
ncbi:MAG: hypothetical protein ABIN36_15145 [Ferruginibacter sp.]